VVRRRGYTHRLTEMPSAVGLLLCGGARRVRGLFRGCRAAGAAGRTNIPALNHHVLLIWSRCGITSRSPDASTDCCTHWSANDSACHAACGGTACGTTRISDGQGREQEGGCNKSGLQVYTHDCFSTNQSRLAICQVNGCGTRVFQLGTFWV
jgi:hypothetical protein